MGGGQDPNLSCSLLYSQCPAHTHPLYIVESGPLSVVAQAVYCPIPGAPSTQTVISVVLSGDVHSPHQPVLNERMNT